MPQTREHLQRAAQNLEFACQFDLSTTPYIDWPVTIYFYAALHLVDALLAEKEGIHPGNHDFRWAFVKEKWYLSGIKHEYRVLKEKSENSRYDLITFTRNKIEQEIIPRYQSIEEHILKQLPKELIDVHQWMTRRKAP